MNTSITNARMHALFLDGPAGHLEALLNAGSENATHCALVTHPHPLYGGTMHNKVVYHAAKALNAAGFPVLRFNFRGAGGSQGTHDEGRGEVDDVRAALAFLKQKFNLPIIFAGFSFGAAVGLRACCPDPDVVALISLGTPLSAEGRHYTYSFLETCTKPKLFISGKQDEYASPERLAEVVSRAAEPRQLVLIDDADHFFGGQLPDMRREIEIWVGRQFTSSPR